MPSLEDQMVHGVWPHSARPSRVHFPAHRHPLPVFHAPLDDGGWPRWTEPPRIAHDTPIIPQAVAVCVWEEACQWLGEELPREWMIRLSEYAEAVYASNACIRRKLRGPGNGGRDWLWAFVRHWLAALIGRQRPELYARLPASFSMGAPLPSPL